MFFLFVYGRIPCKREALKLNILELYGKMAFACSRDEKMRLGKVR